MFSCPWSTTKFSSWALAHQRKVLYSKYCFFLFSILKLPVRCRTGKISSNDEKYKKIWRCWKSVLWLEKVSNSHHLPLSVYQDWDKGKVPIIEKLVSWVIAWQVAFRCDTVLQSHVLFTWPIQRWGNSCNSAMGQETGKLSEYEYYQKSEKNLLFLFLRSQTNNNNKKKKTNKNPPQISS